MDRKAHIRVSPAEAETVTSNPYAPLAGPARLARIANHDLFNPQLWQRLDSACVAAARSVGWQVALVTIVLDSVQFIAGSHGLSGLDAPGHRLPGRAVPIEWSFCAYTVMGDRPYLVPDAADHPNHRGTRPVTHLGVRSYAGVPVRSQDGYPLGAHCLVDSRPRELDGAGIEVLASAAAEVERILEEYRTIPDLA